MNWFRRIKKHSHYWLFIVLVVLFFIGLISIQLIKSSAMVNAINEKNLMTYTGLCKRYNETEQITRTRSVLCTFQMDNNTTLKLHGGIFRTNPEILNLLKESINTPFTYQYIDVHILWEHEYWIVNIQETNRMIIKTEDSLKYYDNGVRLYIINMISSLLILFCILAGFLSFHVLTGKKTGSHIMNRCLKRSYRRK